MRLLVVILDAAERGLVEAWMQDGSLPNLQRLRSRGVYGRLESTAGWLSGSPWPTFYTASMPHEHGHKGESLVLGTLRQIQMLSRAQEALTHEYGAESSSHQKPARISRDDKPPWQSLRVDLTA